MRRTIVFLGILVFLSGCSSIDCPLNNVVYTRYELRGDVTTLVDTLSVIALRDKGGDTLLLNREIQASAFEIPMSYTQPTDNIVISLKDSNSVVRNDTVSIDKTNVPHFESVECSPAYFHKITGVRWTRHTIDSISISKPNVNYDTKGGNLHIYFKSSY